MRPLLVVLVWIVILGGLRLYMQTRHLFVSRHEEQVVIKPLPGEYTLEVTPTFAAKSGNDPFAGTRQPALVVLLNGHEIVHHQADMASGVKETFRWDTTKVPITTEKNEFHVEMFTPDAGVDQSLGARLALIRDGRMMADATIWSPAGEPLRDVVRLDVPEIQTPEAHSH
jgi:hypothetical protein